MTDELPQDGHVLIVDDEPMVTRTLETLLHVDSPWTTSSFNRVPDAVESLKETSYQVVISDFLMPEMDGVQFLSRVREEQPFASRILLTGYADKQNAIRSINEAKLFHYVEKPWNNDALLMVIRNGVERSHLLAALDDKVRLLGDGDRNVNDFRAKLFKMIL